MLIIKVGPNTFTREVVMNLLAFYLSLFNISKYNGEQTTTTTTTKYYTVKSRFVDPDPQ